VGSCGRVSNVTCTDNSSCTTDTCQSGVGCVFTKVKQSFVCFVLCLLFIVRFVFRLFALLVRQSVCTQFRATVLGLFRFVFIRTSLRSLICVVTVLETTLPASSALSWALRRLAVSREESLPESQWRLLLLACLQFGFLRRVMTSTRLALTSGQPEPSTTRILLRTRWKETW
jgi:hypothetical protein